MYLARKRKRKTYHLFDGEDTACKMWSTGGLLHKNYAPVLGISGLQLCHMCKQNAEKGDYNGQHRTR